MQEQLKAIINRFKDNEYYKLIDNKEITPYKYRSENDQHFLREEIMGLNYRIRVMQDIVESLITDGNKMHRIYEEMIHELSMNTETIKDELAQSRRTIEEERNESEKAMGELGDKIDNLKREIEIKEDHLRVVQQKFDELEEKATEKYLEDTEQVKEIQTELMKESRHHQEVIEQSQKQIDQTKKNLTEAIEEIERLQLQNEELRNQNQRLVYQYQALMQKIGRDDAGNFMRIDDRDDIYQEYTGDQMYRCEVQSVKMEALNIENFNLENRQSEDKVYRDPLYTERVPQLLLVNAGKELVNISENYFQYNTKSMQGSKFRDSEENINDYKRKFNLTTNRTLVIDIIGSTTRNQAITENIIEHSICPQKDDPYLAFFRLVVQCQKLNSPHFDKISHLNITYLYQELKKKKIPFNKWQEEIKKELEGKVKGKVVKGVKGKGK